MENAFKKFLEKSQNFQNNNNNDKENNLNSNTTSEKLWFDLNQQKIDLFDFDFNQFKISDEEIECNINKFPMKFILHELLKKRNSKSCK